jgi:secreted trypsin-like serine protease
MFPLVLALTPPALAVMGGESDSTHDAVVAVAAEIDGVTYVGCTGTLIAPRLVLTAAHCGNDLSLDFMASVGGALFGPDAMNPDRVIAISEVRRHPDYTDSRTGDLYDDGSASNDVALLVLEEDADVTPARLAMTALPDDALGQSLLLVGYGKTVHNVDDEGLRRHVSLTIDALDGQHVTSDPDDNATGGNSCWGDLGAPLFGTSAEGAEIQVAITSWTDAHCYRETWSTRVDTVLPWVLDEVAAAMGTGDLCELNGRYGDGVCDADCVAVDSDCEDADAPQDQAGIERACAAASGGGGGWALGLGLLALGLRRRD